MLKKLKTCPECLGVGEIMVAKTTGRGFKYETCHLCNGKKEVPEDLHDDFLLSLNEDNLNFEDE